MGRSRRDRTVYLPGRDRAGLGGAEPQAQLWVEGALDRLAVEADLLGAGAPALKQLPAADVGLLRLAGGERRDLHRARRGVRPRRLEDFGAAGGEGAQVLVGEALDLGDALADLLPAHAEALGQLVAQVGLVDVGGGGGVVVDRRVVEAGPAAVRSLRRVGDQDVGVELGVAVSRGAVAVGGGEEAVALDELRASGSAAGPARLALHVAEGGADGFAVGGSRLRGRRLGPPRPQSRETDFGAEKVRSKPGTGPSPRTPRIESSGSPSTGLRPVSIADELVRADLAFEAEVRGGVADPLAGRLALAGVVVLGAFGDLVEVVALLAAPELSDREHHPLCPAGGRFAPIT